MLPESFNYMEDSEVEEEEEDLEIDPSYTYKLDIENGRIQGMVDNKEAMQQAIYKALFTDRYSDLIYSDEYGSELYTLKGQPSYYAEVLTPDYIEDCLLADDRIESVENIQIMKTDLESIYITFTVVTMFGDLDEKVEVLVNG